MCASERIVTQKQTSEQLILLNRNVLCSIMLALILVGCNQPGSNSAIPTPGKMPMASWGELLTTAQTEASRIDSQAAVQWVSVYYSDDELMNDEPVSTDFVFLRPKGSRMLVQLEDSSPPRVDKVEPDWDRANTVYSQEELGTYKTLLDTIKLSPRDIANKALKSQGDVDRQGSISVALFLDENYESTLGVRSAWGVIYRSMVTHAAVTLYASPQTGEILKAEIGNGSATPTLPSLPTPRNSF